MINDKPLEEEYQLTHSDDDDNSSTSGDSGYCVGKIMDDTTFISIASPETPNFLSRFASIPIVQDSFLGAQNIIKQRVGQKALDFAETKLQTMMTSAQPYIPACDHPVISKANNLGNKSLDLIERQFPIITSPTNEIVNPIKGRIEGAVTQIQENLMYPRIYLIFDQLETILNTYFPEEEQEHDDKEAVNETSEETPIDSRLKKMINRLTRKISRKISATVEEEAQLKQMIRAWVIEQVKLMTQSQQQIETKLYQFTQTEIEKFRQELFKPNTSHVDRIKNILTLSQTDIFVPLYQKSVLIWKKSDN